MSKKNESGSSLSELFDILSSQHRRRLLIALTEAIPRERDEISKDISEDDDPDRLALELYHVHLPKLDATEFIDWDREADTIGRGPRFDEVSLVFTLMNERQGEFPADWT